jgi:hypothetical protein
MPTEVQSPISRPSNNQPGRGQPKASSPGCRSNPSRGDSVPPQPAHVSRGSNEEPKKEE